MLFPDKSKLFNRIQFWRGLIFLILLLTALKFSKDRHLLIELISVILLPVSYKVFNFYQITQVTHIFYYVVTYVQFL